jgi:hypothetical protein
MSTEQVFHSFAFFPANHTTVPPARAANVLVVAASEEVADINT